MGTFVQKCVYLLSNFCLTINFRYFFCGLGQNQQSDEVILVNNFYHVMENNKCYSPDIKPQT